MGPFRSRKNTDIKGAVTSARKNVTTCHGNQNGMPYIFVVQTTINVNFIVNTTEKPNVWGDIYWFLFVRKNKKNKKSVYILSYFYIQLHGLFFFFAAHGLLYSTEYLFLFFVNIKSAILAPISTSSAIFNTAINNLRFWSFDGPHSYGTKLKT